MLFQAVIDGFLAFTSFSLISLPQGRGSHVVEVGILRPRHAVRFRSLVNKDLFALITVFEAVMINQA